MLFLNNKPIDSTDIAEIIKLIEDNQQIKDVNKTFIDQGVVELNRNDDSKVLVEVFQAERAAVNNDQVDYVLSEKATTCQMVAIRFSHFYWVYFVKIFFF